MLLWWNWFLLGGLQEGVWAGADGGFAPGVLHRRWTERGPCWGHSLGPSLRNPQKHRIHEFGEDLPDGPVCD